MIGDLQIKPQAFRGGGGGNPLLDNVFKHAWKLLRSLIQGGKKTSYSFTEEHFSMAVIAMAVNTQHNFTEI